MSARQEKEKRRTGDEMYRYHLEYKRWLKRRPSIIHFIKYIRWRKEEPR